MARFKLAYAGTTGDLVKVRGVCLSIFFQSFVLATPVTLALERTELEREEVRATEHECWRGIAFLA